MKAFFVALIVSIVTLSFFGCSVGYGGNTMTALGESKSINMVTYSAQGGTGFYDPDYFNRLANFSLRLYEMCAQGKEDDFVISPMSVYMAFAV